MKNLKKFVTASIAALLSLSINAAIVLNFQAYDCEEIHYIKDQKMAVYEDGDLRSVTDLKSGVSYEFNHYHQAYSKIELDSFAQETANMMREQMAEVQSSPMYQQMMEHQEKMAAQTKIEIENLGSKKINGIKAEGYLIKKNGKKLMEKWVSSDLIKTISKEFDFSKFQKHMLELTEALSEFMPSDPESDAENEIDQKGIVLLEKEYSEFSFGGGEADLNRSFISMTEESVGSELFEIPSNYSLVPYSEFAELEEEEDEDIW